MKRLIIIPPISTNEELYGFCDGEMIFINLELLWRDSPDFDSFVENYAKIYAHELFHRFVWVQCYKDLETYEERIIDKITGTNKLKRK